MPPQLAVLSLQQITAIMPCDKRRRGCSCVLRPCSAVMSSPGGRHRRRSARAQRQRRHCARKRARGAAIRKNFKSVSSQWWEACVHVLGALAHPCNVACWALAHVRVFCASPTKKKKKGKKKTRQKCAAAHQLRPAHSSTCPARDAYLAHACISGNLHVCSMCRRRVPLLHSLNSAFR